jgi:hypothetical protein
MQAHKSSPACVDFMAWNQTLILRGMNSVDGFFWLAHVQIGQTWLDHLWMMDFRLKWFQAQRGREFAAWNKWSTRCCWI